MLALLCSWVRGQSAQLRTDRDDLRQTLNENMAINTKQVRELQAEIGAREQTQMQTEEGMRTLHLDFSSIVAKLESQLASLCKHQVLQSVVHLANCALLKPQTTTQRTTLSVALVKSVCVCGPL